MLFRGHRLQRKLHNETRKTFLSVWSAKSGARSETFFFIIRTSFRPFALQRFTKEVTQWNKIDKLICFKCKIWCGVWNFFSKKRKKVADLTPDFALQTYKFVYLVSLCNFLGKPLKSKRTKTSRDEKKKFQTSHQISHFSYISVSILFHCVTFFVNLWRAKGWKLVQIRKKMFQTSHQKRST